MNDEGCIGTIEVSAPALEPGDPRGGRIPRRGALVTGVWPSALRVCSMWWPALTAARIEGGPGNGPGNSTTPALSIRCTPR